MNSSQITSVKQIWDNYLKSDMKVLDTKGNEYVDINASRIEAIEPLQKIIKQFVKGNITVFEFKTSIDSFNKRNNYWGFTATKGQMFFNQLITISEFKIELISSLLKECIIIPNNLNDALEKIESLEKYCLEIYSHAKDKRKVPNPGSVGYFLSYFWQIQDHQAWPILYTSLILAYSELNLWEIKPNQKETYNFFFKLNDEIKNILKDYSKKEITNWDAEHAFWNFGGNPNKPHPKKKEVKGVEKGEEKVIALNASFELSEYLIPKVSQLVNLGNQIDISPTKKGSDFERLVSEIFKLLDFEVEVLGQGTGRNPDAILRYRKDNTAFLLDAKAYINGYSLGIDDRAIKEYIAYYCPKLIKEGYKKIGFIIVSNSFRSNFESFINEITWNTEIKRFVLMTSEALLYLLAYKTKDQLGLSSLIESIASFENPVDAQAIINEFDDI